MEALKCEIPVKKESFTSTGDGKNGLSNCSNKTESRNTRKKHVGRLCANNDKIAKEKRKCLQTVHCLFVY